MNKLKILLVDDEPDFLELMATRLKALGYDIVKAADAEQALAALVGVPDIIILDYMLPDMDGITVLRKIREIDHKVPVIMFTAYPDTRSIEGTEELGISAFIPKLSTYSDAQSSLKVALDLIQKNLNKKE